MKSIGVVGTRKITSYGVEVTKMLANDLVQAGCVIVSGLALGVDTIAHQTTLDLGGKTIAVLGCGVDLCYPSANQRIYNSILATGGVVVSEYPLGMQPSKGSFPSRNRIIAGLSDAVLVTEGAEDSGALITAKHALDFGRSVFAVPGPITSSLSKGPFTLIQKGAKLATSGHDVLEVLGIKNYELRKKREKIACETKEEQMIIDLLENESLPVDELIKKTKMHASEMSTLLSFMELKGVVTVRDNFVAIRL